MKIVFLDSEKPKSFDPLEADRSINLYPARMIYLTPIEVSLNNTLVSTLLSDFSYDRRDKVINWTAKSGLQFSDGSPIEVEDIVLAVKRMALARPDFPVIKEIIGLKDWVNQKNPLETSPVGIKVSGQNISIKLARDVRSPLFRFCLELFSVIPRRCVDLKSNHLTCDRPPASGYYDISNSDGSEIRFERRIDTRPTHGVLGEPEIVFKYTSSHDLDVDHSWVNPSTVFFGLDFGLYQRQLSRIGLNLRFRFLPASMYSAVLLNPNVKPFDSKLCRQQFAKALRSAVEDLKDEALVRSSSLFASILPGFISESNWPKNAGCEPFPIDNQITWASVKNRQLTQTETIFSRAMETLKIPTNKVEVENPSDLESLFVSGRIAFRNMGSGFWAMDPMGDLQMLLTPNLHPVLKFVAEDPEVRRLLGKLENLQDEDPNELLKEINRYLYEDAKMIVLLHGRRFYAASSHEFLRELPQAVAFPAPWQVIKAEE